MLAHRGKSVMKFVPVVEGVIFLGYFAALVRVDE